MKKSNGIRESKCPSAAKPSLNNATKNHQQHAVHCVCEAMESLTVQFIQCMDTAVTRQTSVI